ncbi:MAG TPA: hypothetical protein VF403_07945 [Kofleriaceae bacterium]
MNIFFIVMAVLFRDACGVVMERKSNEGATRKPALLLVRCDLVRRMPDKNVRQADEPDKTNKVESPRP